METCPVLYVNGETQKKLKLTIDNGMIQNCNAESNDEEYIMIPAPIDVHTHGFRGYSSEDTDDLKQLALGYAARGIGGFCATLGPRPLTRYLEIFESYQKTFSQPYEGARFLGFHLEGPYLNPIKCGAIDPNTMYEINLKELESFLIQAKGIVKIMTIAPELKHAEEAIRLLNQYGVIASCGHTAASYEESEQSIQWGLSQATHTFNAMKSLYHRDPGLICSVLLNPNVDCELICDTVHVEMPMIQLLHRMKSSKHIICVSDSGKESGFTYPDHYVFDDGTVVNKGAMVQPDGTFAGSTKDLFDAYKTLRNDMKLELSVITDMLAMNAAGKLKLVEWDDLTKGVFTLIDKKNNPVRILVNPNSYLLQK